MKIEICPVTGTSTHAKTCFKLVLSCKIEAHEHTDGCRDDKGKLQCRKKLHEHSKTGRPCRVLDGPTCF
jgi:hypothetical protein